MLFALSLKKIKFMILLPLKKILNIFILLFSNIFYIFISKIQQAISK